VKRGVVAGLVIVVVLLLGFLAMRGVGVVRAFGAVDGTDLYYSVTRELGGTLPDVEPCVRRNDGTWRCEINDKSVSNEIDYRVTLDGRCWSARKVTRRDAGTPPLPKQAEGCVGWRDRLVGWW
jgi:hypothetical protein